ncbi:Pentatricopeptide repeat-containing protein [Capsicum annuum]|uniref:pentatricopeptide repeat-containing protein At5g27110-like n=1 Tax=Capsicum annuum TaxID=4072 RepID=UPI001FB0CDFF|nr:pentatricopeptide repeat-containing protein At5g27110-like [Capsicum annuum]KAF3643898.1 Pentatricopeptide repeat-containing protein [Capsicum annuum]
MDSIKILSLLKSSVNVSTSLKRGKLLHQKIVISGLQSNIILSKNLINLYISCQDFRSAKLVFQNLENPLDITLWNGLIASYTKNHMFNEALGLFEKLLRFPYLKADSYTFPSVLKACCGLGKVEYGQIIHSHLIKTGLLSDVVVTSSVIGVYGKCDFFGSALQLFDEMPERDVACWNTVISCYYQSGQFSKAIQFFEKMKDLRYMPNSVTYTAAISSCARLLDLERGDRIYQELVNDSKFLLDGFVSAALVDMYGKCGFLDKAKEIFEQIPAKSLVSWNSIISGYSLRGDSKSCIELLQRMNNENMKPSPVTLSSLLMACSKSGQLQHGKFLHAYIIRNNIGSDVFLNASLLDLYLKCGRVETAQNIFSKISKNNVEAWNIMISGYVSAGYYLEALAIYNDMKLVGIKPDAITLTSALVSCSQLAALEHGKQIHKCIIDNRLESNEIVMGSLLDMYAKCGAVSEAFEVFDELPERDLVSWTTMIAAYGSHGQAFEALKIFNEMLHSNVKPDRVAFLAVISACAHAGLVDEGYHYFNLMVSGYGIQPSAEEYSCLIDLLGRAGRLGEAYAILQSNPHIKEDVELLSALVSACHLHGELEIGEEIAKMLTQKDKEDPSTYIVLAKIYASQNKWNEIRKLRLKMKDLGLRKKPGCSWIEVEKRIQTFLADDKSFPLVDNVYQCLSLINNDMETDECFSINSKGNEYYSQPTT